MKLSQKFWVLAALFVFLFAGKVQAEGEKIAYVDVGKIFDQYQKTKDNDQTLQNEGKKKETERDGLVHEIRQLKDEMALLADDAKVKKQEELDAKIRALQEFDQTTRQALGEKRNVVVREIFKDIDDAVKRYSETKGLDLVYNERALLYHNPKFDITTEIVTELNKNYGNKR